MMDAKEIITNNNKVTNKSKEEGHIINLLTFDLSKKIAAT